MKKIGLILLIFLLKNVGFAQSSNPRTLFDNAEFVVEPMEMLNTVGSDISPVLMGNELYFSSVREEFFNKPGLEQKNKAFYSLYSAQLDNKGTASSARKLVAGFGAQFHEGPVSYCPATGELFVTLSNTIHPDTTRKFFPAEKIRLRLVIMKRNEGQWKISEELPFNNDRYNFAHPAISTTGDTLVFCSDMDSVGYGRNDLYMAVRKNGMWSKPQNLGEKINTSGNEMFPVFLPGRLLSFASSQHSGNLGGLDIFYTTFPQSGEIKNAGNIINSGFDDFGLTVDVGKGIGYFSSNRPGKGSDDIFSVQFKKTYTTFNGRVVDDLTNSPLINSAVQLSDCNGKVLDTAVSNGKGEFALDIPKSMCTSVQVSKDKYETLQKEITGLGNSEFRLKQKETYLTLKITDKNSGEILTDANFELLAGEYDHASLKHEKGLIRFKIELGNEYTFYATNEGYLPNELKYAPANKDNNGYLLVIPLEKISVGKQFVLENLYYDLNKSNIRADAAQVLDRLAKIMVENPGIKIEIGSHTDCRASDAYNLKLSQKRSEAVVAYLVSKGIAVKRLIPKGYGESRLVNRCADGVPCTEEEHQANRRTVVSILEVKAK